MAETRGECEVTSAGNPGHRGRWPTTWQPRFRREHNTFVCNAEANYREWEIVQAGKEYHA
jgi:hypothetical protein